MTTSVQSKPVPFTSADYAARMSRVVDDAVGTGLAGVIVAPGPDLVWLTGYQPTAITERLTDAGRRFNNTGHHLHVVQ